MKRHCYLWILVGLLVLVSLACNAFAGQPVEPELAQPVAPESDDAGADMAGLPTAVIQNIAPTATLAGELPPVEPTAVVEPVDGDPLLRALVDVNIRLGPGVAYARDSFLLGGETAVVLGYHSESGWWKIVCPQRADGNACWVSGGSQYTRVDNAGAAESVVAPPTPTAEPTVEATVVSDSSAATMTEETESLESAPALGMAAFGARMVYANEDALWLLPLDEPDAAEPIWLADAANVTDLLISPNGRYAAYLIVDEYDASLHSVDIESGVGETLVDAADLAEMASSADLAVLIGQLQWLNNSEEIAFNTAAVNRVGPGVDSQEDLWTVDLAGMLTERFPSGEGGGSFAISPDDVVLFGQTTAVIRANLDGSNRETVITFDFVNTASEFAFYPWLQWNADGTFATTAISSPEPYTTAAADLWRIPLSEAAVPLETVAGNMIFSPVLWSGSGRRLGYVREMDGADTALIIGTGDGAAGTAYTDDTARFFGWNAADSHFVYAGQGHYAVGQVSEEPLIVDIAEGRTAVTAQWLDDDIFIIALGSIENWDFRRQTIDGPATRLISGSSTPLFDIWTP